MANKVHESQTDLMVETKGKLELFFDNYGNKILWGLIGVALVAVAVFVAISIVDGAKQKKEDAAQAALTVAITTDAEVEAYVAVVEQYEGTNAANTAQQQQRMPLPQHL